MKGDVNAVTKWKEREIDRVDAETAQAARWGAERFRKDLADLADRDAQGRLNVGGNAPRTPIAIPNEYMTAREAKAILDAQRGKVFVNQDDGREAKLGGTQVRKLLSNAATKKSVANGFTITQHNQAAAHIGDLYENATLVEERPDRGGDPNIVAIRRYASPITVLRNGQTTPATAWLTIKESEQNGNRIYSLELLELESASVSAEPRDEGLTSNQRLRARTPNNTVAYPGADVNPRLKIGSALTPEARAEMDKARQRHEGTDSWMKAPNGRPTRLTREQWLLVRTPAFKAWFGDWENDPANASKVLDGNGEPLVVYHGRWRHFNIFNDRIDNVKNSTAPYGTAWFASNREAAANAGSPDLEPLACFLNLRKPLIVDADGNDWDNLPEGESTDYLAQDAIDFFRDGLIVRNVVEGDGSLTDDYVVLTDRGGAANIKSATGNTGAFSPADPDIRRSIGGVAPSATSARQKDAHGAYPDLGGVIAAARFSVGAKRKQEYRALIAKARPNLPQEDVDAFMRELDTLNDTKTEKAALHWFVKGALILPEDREKLDMAVRMSGKWHLDFQAFDTPAALINEANARAEAKKKKPAPAYLDPDTVPQLSNKRDLGHGVVVYDVEDSPAGQQAMRQIMNSHLGRNADGEFWSPWCLLTCSPKTGALSESARKYWEHYNKTGRAAAFHNGKLCAFQSSDTKRRKWWDLNDENHGTKIPLPLTITSAEMGYASDDIPGDIVIQNGYEMTKDGELVPVAKPGGRTLLVGTRGSIAEGKTEKWIFASRSVFKAETFLYKDGVLYKSVSSANPAYTIIRFYSDGNQSVAKSSYVGSPYYDRTIKDSNGLTLREDRGLTEEEANQNPFDNPDWRSEMMTPRTGDRRTEYNGGADWTYEVFENGTRIFYAEYRDAGGRGRPHGRTEYIDDDTGALVTEYYDHGVQVNHPVVNERIVPGQGTPQPRRQVGGNARRAPIEATTRTARIGVFREAQRRPGNGTGIDAKRPVHVADLPDWASRYGLPTVLIANGRVLRKLAKKHAFTPELFADLIEALETPVAGFWEDGKGKTLKGRSGRPRMDLVLILDIRTPNRNGAPAASTLVVLSANGDHTMLTTAYGMDGVGETKYVGAINTQLMLWVDKTRVARMPLLAETTLSLNSFNGPSDPSTDTVPNPGEEVKPGARLEVGGAERRLREANARVRTAALYYGRNPAVAEVANRAIAEIALFNEASRTGKKVSRETVKSAYADFGIQADDADAAQIADRLNAMAKSERWSPRDKQGLSPRDALIPQERHLRATYDIHWSQAEKTAYTRGVEGAFGAARALARDAQEIAQTKRAEAEGVLGVAPAASLAKDLCTLDLRSAASEIDDFAKSALSPYRDIQKAVRNLSGHDLDDLWEENETARRLRVRRQMAEAARRNADEE